MDETKNNGSIAREVGVERKEMALEEREKDCSRGEGSWRR